MVRDELIFFLQAGSSSVQSATPSSLQYDDGYLISNSQWTNGFDRTA